MKIVKQKKSPRFTYVIIMLVFLAAGVATGVYVASRTSPTKSTSPDRTPQTTTQEDQKKAKSNPGSGTSSTTDSIPKNTVATARIVTLRQEDGTIKFQGIIANTKSGGTCIVTFENPNDKPVVRSFDSSRKDNSEVCGEIEIPSLEFSYLGNWSVTFRFMSDGSQTVVNDRIDIR